jgi:hypothetical protein
VKIEPATPADRGPILSSWLRSYRTAHSAGLISMDRWADVMRVELEAILDRAETLVARGSDGVTQYAWLCFEGDDLVHFAYVWEAYRKRGVAGALLTAAGLVPKFTYSCRTPIGDERIVCRGIASGRPRPRFNPLPARFGNRPRRKHVEVVQAARP